MATTLTAAPPARRLQSIDMVRGVVMVLMAIDHVRVYSGVPAGGPTAGVFFTRWVTHFCAPAFVFFAGTSAFLLGRKLADTNALARYLLTRGLVLVALELTVIHVSWTFTFDFSQLLAGVIWMIGWCMILMAGLVRFSPRTLGTFGLITIAAQQLFLFVPRLLPEAVRAVSMWLWKFLYLGGEVTIGGNGPTIAILYTIVPWIGVMAAGFAFGAIVIREPEERRRLCLRIGLSATALFVLYGIAAAFLMPADGPGPKLFRILNPPKYPASQPFLLMTLGPTIALLPFADRAGSLVARVFATYGRVPMFYYLLHIPGIHAAAALVWYLRDGTTHAAWFTAAPYVSVEEAQRWGLPLLYLVFVIVVAMLYVPCRSFAGVKARQRSAWLRYL